jgi:hypothetical protein
MLAIVEDIAYNTNNTIRISRFTRTSEIKLYNGISKDNSSPIL